MFASTVLNYMDRQTISLVKDQIATAFSLKADVDFGWVLAAFGMTYALFQVPAGFLVDRWDLRWSYAAAVAWWSLAAMATALVPSLGMLIVCRALLGMGESFNWPCALRVTARVLPPSDRSLGNGIFNSGAAVGAVVTPIVVTTLTALMGLAGRVPLDRRRSGFIWVAAWLALVQGPERQLLARDPCPGPADVSAGEPAALVPTAAIVLLAGSGLAHRHLAVRVLVGTLLRWLGIAWRYSGLWASRPLAAGKLKGAEWAVSLGEVVRLRRFWVMIVVAVSINICWHFLVNWIPTVLEGRTRA